MSTKESWLHLVTKHHLLIHAVFVYATGYKQVGTVCIVGLCDLCYCNVLTGERQHVVVVHSH